MRKVFIFLILGMFMISFGSAGLIDNIISYYELEESSGSIIVDQVFVNNGTYFNNLPTNVSAIINDGQDVVNGDYMNFSNVFDISGDFTINFWHNREAGTGAFARLMSYDFDGGTNAFHLVWQTSTELRFRPTFAGVNRADAVILGVSGWTMITLVRSGNTASLYKNGVLGTTSSVSGGAGSSSLLIADDGSGSRIIDGKFDEIGMWERELNSTEILQLYNSGDGFQYPFIVPRTVVTLNSPPNNTLQSSSVTFNVTLETGTGLNLTNATLFIWDSNGDIFTTDTNIVTGDTINTTTFLVTNLTTGNYEWNVLGSSENSTGFLFENFSQFNNTFTWVPFSVDNEVFQSNVFETSRQDFLLNITTLPSVLSMDAILNYNGTRFTADTTCSSGLCEVSTAIDIPLITIGQSQNKSFFWEISIFDGTNSLSTNLSVNQQNVTRLNLQKCNATFTTQTLNFTSFDEDTENIISPFMFDGTFNFWLGTGSIKRNNSISESSISSLQLCILPSTETFFLDGTIVYDEATDTNYTNRNYFFQNDQINNISQDIKLGLLLSEDSTSFILKVQDRDILPVSDVLIFTERFYPGEGIFRVVQVSQTDDSGRTVGFFETETVDYRFVLKQNGVTVLTTNKQKIVGDSVPFTLTFTIGDDEGAAWEPFEELDDLVSDLNFNKTSSIVSFTYLDTSGDFELARLIVEKINASGLQNDIVCSETSTQSSATITCNLTGNSTGAYIMRGIITRDGVAILVEQEGFEIEDFSTISGRLGLFLGWFIILISVFTFKFNEVAGIILVNISMIFVNMMGLIAFGYVFISAMIAISIIILVVLER